MRDLTCKERIDDNFHERLEDFKAFNALIDGEENQAALDRFGLETAEDVGETLSNYGLSISKETVIKYSLSWGGPADCLLFHYDEDGLVKVIYRFSDWFDYAELDILPSHPDFETFEEVANYLGLDYL